VPRSNHNNASQDKRAGDGQQIFEHEITLQRASTVAKKNRISPRPAGNSDKARVLRVCWE
jgi:hypothetical protein